MSVPQMQNPDNKLAGVKLTIDLAKVCQNWQKIKDFVGKTTDVAAVVKANAYGLGAVPVATALWQAGARHFFVALPEEGAELRAILPKQAKIYILGGLWPSASQYYDHHHLIPVLNTISMIEEWQVYNSTHAKHLPCILQIETGMNRLGLSQSDCQFLLSHPHLQKNTFPDFLMSHFACADTPEHSLNTHQFLRFQHAYNSFQHLYPRLSASLSNSAGIFLPSRPHFHLVRPGIALYGGRPTHTSLPIDLSFPLHLQAQIIQIRSIDSMGTVGYGATRKVNIGSKIAVIALGYADGYHRCLGDQAEVMISGYRVPVIGRISMDVMTADVSTIPENILETASWADILGPTLNATDLAKKAGTIDYEILTSLGHRSARYYVGQEKI